MSNNLSVTVNFTFVTNVVTVWVKSFDKKKELKEKAVDLKEQEWTFLSSLN